MADRCRLRSFGPLNETTSGIVPQRRRYLDGIQSTARYAPGTTPERLLEASFEFLLEREPASSILSRFALPEIERYFPEYPRVIAQQV